MNPILEVKNLEVQFPTEEGIVRAVNGVSFEVYPGEILGLVGESGCGKTVTALAIMGILPEPGRITAGQILWKGKDLLKLKRNRRRRIQGKEIAMIFQDPETSFNPVLSIGDQITESAREHLKLGKPKIIVRVEELIKKQQRSKNFLEKLWRIPWGILLEIFKFILNCWLELDKKEISQKATEYLSKLNIPNASERIKDYPHQYSGGMKQRAMIALALSCNPELVLADEPTTNLDVTIQAQVLEDFKREVKERKISAILITHNLGLVTRYCNRVAVMYAGKIIETAEIQELFENPQHPYTQGLIAAVPRLDRAQKKLYSIEGFPPNLLFQIQGCSFFPRCQIRRNRCQTDDPELKKVETEHLVACHFSGEKIIQPIDSGFEKRDLRGETILEVKNLKVYFPVVRGVLGIFEKKVFDIKAVDGISFSIKRGETLGLAGESGCGKSTTAKAICQLEEITEGEIIFEGKNLCQLSAEELRRERRKIQFVFQNPFSSLNPRLTVSEVINEPLEVHGIGQKKEREEKIKEVLKAVGLDPKFSNRYPHEFSTGQRQRVSLARALVLNPSLIILDEPISALDVSIQAQILNLLQELQEKFRFSYLFIAHDLAVVKHISDRVAIMYLGKIVEIASKEELYKNPLHPYTQALISAVPIPDPKIEATRQRIFLKGEVGELPQNFTGCKFYPRCPIGASFCQESQPELKGVTHQVACHRI